jgi:hypothetical protein
MSAITMDARRALVAEAVHRAVCEVTGTDGHGCCADYALVGAALAQHALGHTYAPFAGTLRLQHDRDDPLAWVAFDATGGGLHAGEFHCWFVRVPEGMTTGTFEPLEVVDLASRHYASLVERSLKIQAREGDPGRGTVVLVLDPQAGDRWRREPPPDYLWVDGYRPPEWVHLVQDGEATRALSTMARQREDHLRKLCRATWVHYQRLLAGAEQP